MSDDQRTQGEETESRDPRRVRAGKSALLLRTLVEARQATEHELQQAHESHLSDENVREMQLRADIAGKRVEIFLREHDATGAWKGERLWRDLSKDMREMTWERDAEGLLLKTPEDERTHLLVVHMGELDRLNASGDHSLGDQGLRLTAERIESLVREVLSRDPAHKDERRLADAYDVYRYSGNDFAVNLRDVDPSSAEEIRRRLSQDTIDLSGIRPNEEPIPIAASRISRADGLDLMNRVDERPEDVGLDPQRVLIQAMIEKAQTLNDIDKVEMRAQRMVEKIREAGGDSLRESAARDLYDKFLRKSLGDVFRVEGATEPADYDAFRRLLTEKRALDIPASTEWTHLVAARALDGAFESLRSRRAVGRSIELKLAAQVSKDVLSRDERFGIVTGGDELPPSSPDFSPPQDTRGKKRLMELEGVARKAEKETPGLPAERARTEYELEKSKRDERTGLYGRGVYFETMEAALEHDRPLSTIAIDMAFLKYFDKEGGPETGNLAIRKAAEILDSVSASFVGSGFEVEAFRVGGDEFALTIVGGDEQSVGKVIAALREAQRNAGRVPGTTGASPRYRSEGLQFNYGIRFADSADAFRLELEAGGIPTRPPEEGDGASNMLAEYLVRLADKEVEIQKGVNRFMLLLNRTLEVAEGSNLDLLKAYSQKAIFGATGEEKLSELVEMVRTAPDRVVALGRAKGEALAFVIAQIDKRNAEINDFEMSLDRRLEDAVRIRFFEQRIGELEEEVRALEARIQSETAGQRALRQAVEAAEEEKRAIVQLREQMTTRREEVGLKQGARTAA
jgi:GGDEF domain-containing protein